MLSVILESHFRLHRPLFQFAPHLSHSYFFPTLFYLLHIFFIRFSFQHTVIRLQLYLPLVSLTPSVSFFPPSNRVRAIFTQNAVVLLECTLPLHWLLLSSAPYCNTQISQRNTHICRHMAHINAEWRRSVAGSVPEGERDDKLEERRKGWGEWEAQRSPPRREMEISGSDWHCMCMWVCAQDLSAWGEVAPLWVWCNRLGGED